MRAAVAAALLAAGVAAASDVQYTVRSDGSGNFTNVQAALDFCDPGNNPGLGRVTLLIKGHFFERVQVYSNFSGGVLFQGEGATPLDALLEYNVSGPAAGGTFNSWSVRVDAPNVTFANVAVANSAYGYNASRAGQSVALHITGDTFACWGCALLGAQDTLYTGEPGIRSLFSGTYINGSCDALFGGSSTVFEDCDIDMSFTVSAHRGDGTTAYLITGSRVTSPTSVLLGRPWGEDARVVFKDTVMTGVSRLGWDDWGHDCTKGHSAWCDTVFYAEWNSTGPGADPAGRPWWTHQLNATEAAQWTPAAVLRGWVPVPPPMLRRTAGS